jgi:hypothetical protein
MTERDELQELWVSQPLQDWKEGKMPRFALLEDEIADVSSPPLSIWNKAVFAFWCVYASVRLLQGWTTSASVLERAGMAVLVLSALITAAFVLLQRDKSRPPRTNESVADYRAAYINEFERQYRIERRAIISLFVGASAGMVLYITGRAFAGEADPMDLLLPLVFLLASTVVLRIRRVQWTRGLNRLRYELEDIQ